MGSDPVMSDEVLVSTEGALLRVTLNRPQKRNPLSRAVLTRLREIFDGHADNEALSLALITGAGDRSFAAGGDLRDLEQVTTPEAARALFDLGNGAFHAIRGFPVPVIAALNGLAIGGGAELALACDLRIAAAHARIGFVQGTLNISTAWGGGSDLIATVGPARGLQLMAEATVLGARDALEAGLVDEIAKDGEAFQSFVARVVDRWLKQKAQVLRAFKWQSAARKLGLARSEIDARDRELFVASWCHEDHWAAARGLLDREKAK
jgi:enoyl-CoA hydratase